MPKKCITLNDITYKDKLHKIDKIIFVDEKDVRKLEKQGAVRCLVRPKKKRVVRPKIKKVVAIKFESEKIKKYIRDKKTKKITGRRGRRS